MAYRDNVTPTRVLQSLCPGRDSRAYRETVASDSEKDDDREHIATVFVKIQKVNTSRVPDTFDPANDKRLVANQLTRRLPSERVAILHRGRSVNRQPQTRTTRIARQGSSQVHDFMVFPLVHSVSTAA